MRSPRWCCFPPPPAPARVSSRSSRTTRCFSQAATQIREATLDEIRSLGADAIKANVDWATVAPAGRRKPAGFDGSDPADYPGWGVYDEFLADAQARGFEVIFALTPPAPSWATKGKRGRYEKFDRPSAREYGRFAEAAATRYSSVDVWSFYNEPNLFKYLYPQSRNGRAVRAASLPRHGSLRSVRSAARGGRRRPDPVRRAAPPGQPLHRARGRT